MKGQITIFFLICRSIFCQAQDVDQTLLIANSAFTQEDFLTASALYERVLFFDDALENTAAVYEKLADSHFKLTHYSEAYYYYDLAITIEENAQREVYQNLIKKADCAIRKNDFFDALAISFSINAPEQSAVLAKHQIQALAYYKTGKIQKSFDLFNALCNGSEACQQQLKNLQAQAEKINNKSPKKARILSMIFPGLGFYYLGEWKKGINSTLLVGGLGTLLIFNSISTGFFNAFFNIMPWYQRYFMGGYTKAEMLAYQKIENELDSILLSVLELYEQPIITELRNY